MHSLSLRRPSRRYTTSATETATSDLRFSSVFDLWIYVDPDDFRKHFEKSNPSHTTHLQGTFNYSNKVKVKLILEHATRARRGRVDL